MLQDGCRFKNNQNTRSNHFLEMRENIPLWLLLKEYLAINYTKFVLICIFKTGNDIGQKIKPLFGDEGKYTSIVALERISCNKLHKICFNLHI